MTIINETQFIKLGYIYDQKYQNRFQTDIAKGKYERITIGKLIRKNLIDSLNYLGIDYYIKERGNNITFEVDINDNIIEINFDTISSIVSKNKDRAIEGSTRFPYIKRMDKFNSYYLSINFVNDIHYKEPETFFVFNEVIKEFMTNMNKVSLRTRFRYRSLNIPRNL